AHRRRAGRAGSASRRARAAGATDGLQRARVVRRRERGLVTAARSPARRWFRRLGWVGLVLFGAGCASELDRDALDGRPCPCLPRWVCDARPGEAGTCVREGAALAGDLRNASSDVPDAGAAAVLGDSAD